jgi:CDGSH-type Zn-finger protein
VSRTEPVEAFIAEEGGPLLIRGPIKVTLPDGQRAESERPVAALCLCRRSKTYPWCDTSHRKHTRTDEHEERS